MDEIILSKKLFDVGKGKYSNLNALIVGGSGTNKLGFKDELFDSKDYVNCICTNEYKLKEGIG